MKTGRPPLPRRKLSADLITAIRCAGQSRREQASRAGWTSSSRMLQVLGNRSGVIQTPQTLKRLRALAKVVHYAGPLFVDSDVSVTMIAPVGQAASAQEGR